MPSLKSNKNRVSCRLETEQLKAVTGWLEKVQEIWEGNYKRLDALLAELKQAQKEERKK